MRWLVYASLFCVQSLLAIHEPYTCKDIESDFQTFKRNLFQSSTNLNAYHQEPKAFICDGTDPERVTVLFSFQEIRELMNEEEVNKTKAILKEWKNILDDAKKMYPSNRSFAPKLTWFFLLSRFLPIALVMDAGLSLVN